jgi:hypothetical protein
MQKAVQAKAQLVQQSNENDLVMEVGGVGGGGGGGLEGVNGE